MQGARTFALQFQRFTRLNRTLHILMIVSFISLALTGMTLKFSYTGWAAFIARRLGGYEGAGFVHRAAATLMFGLFVTHLWDLNRKRKQEYGGSFLKLVLGPDSMLFNRRDLDELVGSLKWFVGKGPRPRYGRWTYWEKFDYFAVFWGIFVIGATGLMLWFRSCSRGSCPGWLINVATIVHSDEALLATRVHLHGALLQHPPAAREVPDGHGRVHRAECPWPSGSATSRRSTRRWSPPASSRRTWSSPTSRW